MNDQDRQILALFIRRHITGFMQQMLKVATERECQTIDGKFIRARKHPLEIEIFIREFCRTHRIDLTNGGH